MSNRALRDYMEMRHRLQRSGAEEDDRGDGAEGEAAEEQEVEEEREDDPRDRRRNVFDLLDEDGEGEEDQESQEEESEEEDEDEEEVEVEEVKKTKRGKKRKQASQRGAASEGEPGKKERRRRRNKKNKGAEDGEEEEEEGANNSKEEEAESSKKGDAERVLVVQSRYFDPDQEMRALFGAEALAASGLGRTAARWPPNSVVRGRPEWARAAGAAGLGMRRLGGRRFAFEWAPRYAAVQRAYEAAAASLDVQELLELLHDAPWHADTLYQVALVRLQLGEAAAAEELLARSLYAMQGAFHHLFGTRGDCRLRYADHPQNRTFLLALFRYAAVLAARGCVRAALELTKLLYTLDPSDPLGALLVMDHYAVKAAQYDVLAAMAALPALGTHDDGDNDDGTTTAADGGGTGNTAAGDTDSSGGAAGGAGTAEGTEGPLTLGQLPNMRFSLALAEFRQETARERRGDEHSVSGAMLERALVLFPLVGRLLLARDAKSEHAARLLAGRVFGAAAVAATPEALAHIAAIFVERNSDLWHEPDVHAWFLAHCDAVAARAESRASAATAGEDGGSTVGDEDADADAQERRALYARCMASAVLRGTYRHLLVSDFGSTVAQIPRDAVMDLIAQDGGGHFRAFDAAARPVVRAPTNNVLRLLLYTLLPWVPVPNAPAE